MNRSRLRRIVAVGLTALVVAPIGALAQDPPHHHQRLSLTWGTTHLKHQDLIHTPFVHTGAGGNAALLRWERRGEWVQFAEGAYSSLPSSLVEPYPISHEDHHHRTMVHQFHLANAQLGIGRTLTPRWSGRPALGLSLRFDLQATDYTYGTEPNFGYFLSPSLNAWAGWVHDLPGGTTLGGSVVAPIAAWVARSPYMVNDDAFIENIAAGGPVSILAAFLGDGSPATWNRLQRVGISADLLLPIWDRWEVGLSYRFDMLRHSDPLPLSALQNSVGLAASIRP